MTNPSLIEEIIADPERKLTAEENHALFRRYPFFLYPQIRAFESAADATARDQLRRRVAMNMGDKIALRSILGVDPEEFSSFYPDMAPVSLSTEDTIDTFLSTFGKNPGAEGDGDNIPLAAPAIDYASMYIDSNGSDPSATPSVPEDSTSSAIDSFLKAVPAPKSKADNHQRIVNKPIGDSEKPTAKESEAPALTESLARVMIKNKNYRKALEIIMELNLKNPEKSVYFADQIRFLRKLIINESKS